MSILTGLPSEIVKKINKTKQTRGAQPYDRVPYQNRVNRDGVAIVPYAFRNKLHPTGFQAGYRILVRPQEYFSADGVVKADFDKQITIGKNAFIYYDNRSDWTNFPILKNWKVCKDRSGNGHYLARVPATTAKDNGDKVVEGEPQGIRFFEYATPQDIKQSIAQLAWLAWMTKGINEVRTDEEKGIPSGLLTYLKDNKLDDISRFVSSEAVKQEGNRYVAVCPLCQEVIDASGLMTRLEQAEGREVVDLTVTEINLFHLKDLWPGEYNHQPYMLAWGHHHCNTVARDKGVAPTVSWMKKVLENRGFSVKKKAG